MLTYSYSCISKKAISSKIVSVNLYSSLVAGYKISNLKKLVMSIRKADKKKAHMFCFHVFFLFCNSVFMFVRKDCTYAYACKPIL